MTQTIDCAEKLRRAIRPTTFIEVDRLSSQLGCRLTIASETFQRTGSFKFRAAYNVAQQTNKGHLIAASSGNFGQALACACQMLSKACTIVMPDTSAQVKVDAVRYYGGTVDLVNIKSISRAERVKQLALQNPDAEVVSAYDDQLVIDGNASLGEELCQIKPEFDVIIIPIGGGGLASGIIRGLHRSSSKALVFGAEPQMANDASLSFRAGKIIANEHEPTSIADGARTLSVGLNNWPLLQSGLTDIIEVPEELIEETVRVLFKHANLKVEPTGALAVAALMAAPERFAGKSVCCVVSGGNVDLSVYTRILNAK